MRYSFDNGSLLLTDRILGKCPEPSQACVWKGYPQDNKYEQRDPTCQPENRTRRIVRLTWLFLAQERHGREEMQRRPFIERHAEAHDSRRSTFGASVSQPARTSGTDQRWLVSSLLDRLQERVPRSQLSPALALQRPTRASASCHQRTRRLCVACLQSVVAVSACLRLLAPSTRIHGLGI